MNADRAPQLKANVVPFYTPRGDSAISEEEITRRPDPVKLFMVNWGFGVIYLALLISGLYLLRNFIPQIPEPFLPVALISCLYVILSLTRGTINSENQKTLMARPRVFWDETIWKAIAFILMVLLLLIAGFLLYQSWKWFIFVFLLSNLLFFSGWARGISWLILLPIYYIFMRRS